MGCSGSSERFSRRTARAARGGYGLSCPSTVLALSSGRPRWPGRAGAPSPNRASSEYKWIVLRCKGERFETRARVRLQTGGKLQTTMRTAENFEPQRGPLWQQSNHCSILLAASVAESRVQRMLAVVLYSSAHFQLLCRSGAGRVATSSAASSLATLLHLHFGIAILECQEYARDELKSHQKQNGPCRSWAVPNNP